jgi:5-methylthioadenosine/S-adenosylhomocysteine deaminase
MGERDLMNLLLKNIDVITGDTENGFLKSADIGITGDRIKFVRPAGNLPETFIPEKTIDGRHRLAMPGLVNAHTHSGMTILRNAADDMPLEKWLFNRIFPLEERLNDNDIYWGTMLGIAEMLLSGTTAFADMYLHMDAVAQAVCETGIRANLSRSPLDFRIEGKLKIVDVFEECRNYHKNWHGKAEGRLVVYVEVHSAYLFDRESLENAALLAKELNAGIHIHILETIKERKDSFEKYKMSPVEICERTGIFDVPVIAAHCVHLSDEDIATLFSKGVNVAHNPTSNLKLGSGIARVPEMTAKGINVALGTDGAASNNNLSMFKEMQMAALIHKGVHLDPETINAGQAIAMATVNGAKALGFVGMTGVIKEGMKADITILDMDKPHICPLNDPISAVVYAAQASDVDTVIVDGAVLLEKGRLVSIDIEKVKYEVSRIAARVLKG